MKSERHYWFAGTFGKHMLDALLRTVTFRVMTNEPHLELQAKGQRVIYTLWHGRLLPLTFFHRNHNIATLISQSSDGEYIARVVERWGYTPIRGSSSRGGSSALREMVKLARKGQSLAITPDGPRGPKQQLKPGVLMLAQLTGHLIIPMSASATRAWWVDARWDHFLVPKPFSKVYVRYAEPVAVPRDADESELSRIGTALQATLVRLTEETDHDAHA
jgi:lysophospholipid acyltransferase (LPLAT)-like uncharacterized protein